MKRVISLLAVLVLCLGLAGCGGMNVKEELTAEKWYDVSNPEITIEFYETGTGKLDGASNLNFEWTEIKDADNAVRVTFGYTGVSCDYQLVDVDGVVTLQRVGEDLTYVRAGDL